MSVSSIYSTRPGSTCHNCTDPQCTREPSIGPTTHITQTPNVPGDHVYIAFRPQNASSKYFLPLHWALYWHLHGWRLTSWLQLNREPSKQKYWSSPLGAAWSPNKICWHICVSTINASDCVRSRDLGVLYDSTLKWKPTLHIRTVCKMAYTIKSIYILAQLGAEVHYGKLYDTARNLIHWGVQANVAYLLDYCNGLLIDI